MVTFLLPPLEVEAPPELVLELLLLLLPQAPNAETAMTQPAIASQRGAKGVPSSRKPVKGDGTLTRPLGRCQAVNRPATCFAKWISGLREEAGRARPPGRVAGPGPRARRRAPGRPPRAGPRRGADRAATRRTRHQEPAPGWRPPR